MVRTANKLGAFVLAMDMLLLPLAFAIHTHSHTHTFKYSIEEQWQDEGSSQCQLCVEYFHQVVDYSEVFSIDFYLVEYPFQFHPFWMSGYTASPNLLYLRGPPLFSC